MTSLNSIIWSNDFPSVSTALSSAAVSGARSETADGRPVAVAALEDAPAPSVRMALTLFRETPNVSASVRSAAYPHLEPAFFDSILYFLGKPLICLEGFLVFQGKRLRLVWSLL